MYQERSSKPSYVYFHTRAAGDPTTQTFTQISSFHINFPMFVLVPRKNEKFE